MCICMYIHIHLHICIGELPRSCASEATSWSSMSNVFSTFPSLAPTLSKSDLSTARCDRLCVAVGCSMFHHGAALCGPVLCCAVRCSEVLCSTVKCGAVKCGAVCCTVMRCVAA